MDGELKKFKKENLILKQHIAEEKDKLRAAEADIEAEKEKVGRQTILFRGNRIQRKAKAIFGIGEFCS